MKSLLTTVLGPGLGLEYPVLVNIPGYTPRPTRYEGKTKKTFNIGLHIQDGPKLNINRFSKLFHSQNQEKIY